jgi:hypothetical protein
VLKEQVENAVDLALHGVAADPDLWFGIVSREVETLWAPIVSNAFQSINYQAVAKAMLIQARKWSPSKNNPEAL